MLHIVFFLNISTSLVYQFLIVLKKQEAIRIYVARTTSAVRLSNKSMLNIKHAHIARRAKIVNTTPT